MADGSGIAGDISARARHGMIRLRCMSISTYIERPELNATYSLPHGWNEEVKLLELVLSVRLEV